MMTKKPGPPVPPRPSAAIVANALAKSRENSPIPGMTPGRTVVYKSPPPPVPPVAKTSISVTECSNNKIIITNGNSQNGNSSQKSIEIVINNNNNSSSINGKDENLNLKPIQIETYTKSPSMTRSKRFDQRSAEDQQQHSEKVVLQQIETRNQFTKNDLVSSNTNGVIATTTNGNNYRGDRFRNYMMNNQIEDHNFLDYEHDIAKVHRNQENNDGTNRSGKKMILSNDREDSLEFPSFNYQTDDIINNNDYGLMENNRNDSVIIVSNGAILKDDHLQNRNLIEIKTVQVQENMRNYYGNQLLDSDCEVGNNNNSNKKKRSTFLVTSSSSASSESSSSVSSLCNNNDERKLFTEIIISNGCGGGGVADGAETPSADSSDVIGNANIQNGSAFGNSKSTGSHGGSSNNKHYISVRTPSPPPGIIRPEPEGGETINDKIVDDLPTRSNPQSKTPGNKKIDRIPTERKVAFHEMLISELTAMHKSDKLEEATELMMPKVQPRKKRYPSDRSSECSPNGTQRSRIRTSDWIEVGDNGKEVVFSSCQISLEDSGMEDEERLDDISSGVGDSWDSAKDNEERISMSLPGLPPLPKSLSGFELQAAQQLQLNQFNLNTINEQSSQQQQQIHTPSSQTNPVPSRKTTLDTQLAILRREMCGLRDLDLTLLHQLWALNESIQEFRTIMQDQEVMSPPSPSQSISDGNSISSGDEGDSPIEVPITRMRMAPPPPPPVSQRQKQAVTAAMQRPV